MTEGCSWALVRSLSIRTFFSCLPDLGRWGCWANGAVYSLKLGSRPAFLEVLPRSDWARYCVSWRRSQRAARRKAVNFTVHSKSIRFVMSEHVNNGPLCRLFRRTPLSCCLPKYSHLLRRAGVCDNRHLASTIGALTADLRRGWTRSTNHGGHHSRAARLRFFQMVGLTLAF